MNRSLLWMVVWLVAGSALPASGTSIISVGDHALRPNFPGQQVQVFVSGGDAVQGVNLFVQMADGGLFAGGTATGPVITGVNITSGTIFASNNTGARGAADGPLFWEMGTTTSSGTVTTDGLLATVTVDTTGIFTGSFALSFKPALASSDFADPNIPVVINDGTLTMLVNSWQNSLDPLDINADTRIDALDVLQIVNELNANGTHDLVLPVVPPGPPPFYDASGDTVVSPLDALLVVNYINSHPPQGSLQSLATPSSMLLTSASVVPEPSTWSMAIAALAALGLAWRRRR